MGARRRDLRSGVLRRAAAAQVPCAAASRPVELGKGQLMPTYVMLTTVGPDGWARIREQPERINEVTAEVEAMGLTVVAQYALLGQWDFLNVIEAPDEATMARAAVALAAHGTMRTTTLQAVSVDELIATLPRLTLSRQPMLARRSLAQIHHIVRPFFSERISSDPNSVGSTLSSLRRRMR